MKRVQFDLLDSVIADAIANVKAREKKSRLGDDARISFLTGYFRVALAMHPELVNYKTEFWMGVGRR